MGNKFTNSPVISNKQLNGKLPMYYVAVFKSQSEYVRTKQTENFNDQ